MAGACPRRQSGPAPRRPTCVFLLVLFLFRVCLRVCPLKATESKRDLDQRSKHYSGRWGMQPTCSGRWQMQPKGAAIISVGPVGTEQAYVLLTREAVSQAEAMFVADNGDRQDYS